MRPIERPALIVLVVATILLISVVAYHSYVRLAIGTFVKAVRAEAHLFLFKLNFEGLRGEIQYSQPTLLVIAHAGGAVAGRKYRNAMEGLVRSSELGCQYMELDFNWTADNKLVSIHYWSNFFGEPLEAIPTEKEFLSRPRADGLTQMTFADVASWLGRHPRISLVTDVKTRNLDALRLIATTNVREQIVPQVYRFSEFEEARKLGFSRVIFSNYVMRYTESALVRFAATARPFAVTVPKNLASESLANELSALHIALFTHPVDTISEVHSLPKRITGIYSSTLCGLVEQRR